MAILRQLTKRRLWPWWQLTGMRAQGDNPPSSKAAQEELARPSPHRSHESNWFKGLLCAVGLHRWYSPNLTGLMPQRGIRFCRWCSAVRVPSQLSEMAMLQ
jgi:hypothetical protein